MLILSEGSRYTVRSCYENAMDGAVVFERKSAELSVSDKVSATAGTL